MNRIVIIGRLVRDIETRYTQSGAAVANFTLAVDRTFKNASGQKETDYINVIAWKQLAEHCANYLSKGKMAAVCGSLQIRNYETKDGQKRTIAEVVAEDVQFLSPRDGSDQAKRAIQDDISSDDMPIIDDDELPF